jgi:hypothetical protein
MKPWFSILLLLLLTACTSNATSAPIPTESSMDSQIVEATATETTFVEAVEKASETPDLVEALPTATITPTQQIMAEATSTARPTLAADDWQSLPVIPQISQRALDIYERGLEMGNNPQAFSKIGDCESTPTWFLGDFDLNAQYYSLGEYEELKIVIENYQGSFGRTSLAAKSGYTATSALTPLWADRTQCEKNETPLACEYRVHRPSIAFIMLGTNDVFHPDTFEEQMRKIIEYTIDQGIIPVLATKADNLEGDGSINGIIARLAWEYDIPLWNFWLAVQPLPDHGLQEDGSHLTWAQNWFDDPKALKRAWPVRNLTALQILDSIWHSVSEVPAP